MCFSATASFITATFTGAIGLAAVAHARSAREIPLASIPLFFGLQQSIEGGLWVALSRASEGTAVAGVLTQAFLVLALIFWPIFAPAAALAIEADAARRRAIAACLALGAGVAVYFAWQLSTYEHTASILAGHISYGIRQAPLSLGGAYLIATTLPLLLSSRAAVSLFGLVVLAGSLASYAAYQDAFISVWCFFAAAGSVVILVHFRLTRPRAALG